MFINVKENPIIEKITYKGIKRKKTLDEIRKDALFKSRSSFNEYILGEEKNRLSFILKDLGYYNSQINIFVKNKEDNLVDIEIDLILGERAKIKQITFVGNKIFKDSKLKRIIASSEYKFWKFLSGRKFLNENVVEFDKRLLKNFYKNNGYYNVQINSSFAKLIDKNEFELVFNIDARPKIYFGELNLNLPIDFEKENFSKIYELFDDIKNEHYSINVIDKILDEIDTITTLEQYKFIKATVEENIVNDKINLSFNIGESEKFYVEKINIFGNTVTSENVIRNQFDVDEGDPFNELLVNKSINNIKSLNFFKTVKNEVITNEKNKTKVLNIIVEEKPTGEISAQAGIGTSGGSVGLELKENNFLGKGIGLDSNFTLSDNSFKGKFTVSNPNFRNSDKSIYVSAEAIETDNYKTFGYKSNKTGFTFGTNFEYKNDFFLGLGSSNFYEKLRQIVLHQKNNKIKKVIIGDSFLKFNFDYDKRNQKFQTNSGFRSFYSLDLPVISETATLKNYYNNTYYFDLFDKNITSIGLYLESAKSINNKDVKLSERVTIPSKRLRGFEAGRVGPKDGNDFIGGNYAYSINFSSTIPQLFEESQNTDFLFFADLADIWGVDYDASLIITKLEAQ